MFMKNQAMLHLVSTIFVLVGGVNLGFWGLIRLNIIESILGQGLGRIIYILIGIAAGYLIYEEIMKRKGTTPPGSV